MINEVEMLRLRVRRLEEIVARFFTDKMNPKELEAILEQLRKQE